MEQLVFQLPVLQEPIGMEQFAQHQIVIAQLVLTGKGLLVLQLPTSAPLVLYGMALSALQTILNVPWDLSGMELIVSLSNVSALLE